MEKVKEYAFAELALSDGAEGFSNTLLTYGDIRHKRGFLETVKPTRLGLRNRAMLNLHHQRHMPIASAATPHLDIIRSDSGLSVVLNSWPDTATAREAKAQLDAGVITGLSIEYFVNEAQWGQHEGQPLRIVRDLDVVDLALVDEPAFPKSEISRAYDERIAGAVRIEDDLWLLI